MPDRPLLRLYPFRTLLVSVVLATCALALGTLSGLAAQVVVVFGLYDVLAALALSFVAVVLAHLTRVRPSLGLTAASVVAAVLWLGAYRVADAYLFRLEQATHVAEHSEDLAAEFAASGTDTPLQLVDAGLVAQVGVGGWRGAMQVQLNAGLLAWRAAGVSRVAPMPFWLHVLIAAAEAAFVALVVHRALGNLTVEPTCARCGSYLNRKELGRVDEPEADRLRAAWGAGNRVIPAPTKGSPGFIAVYEDRCPMGHTIKAGYALVRLRGHGRSTAAPGPLASLPAELHDVDGPTASQAADA
ncbi:MAG: hypothetical protein ACOYOB_05365 [Myxococcota bacterium]